MTLQRFGGLAGLTCAATYLFGFVFLVTRLAPLGYGTNEIDGNTVVDFIQTEAGFLILWNTVIYIVNALALTLLVVALHKRLRTATPGLSAVTAALGIIWAALVLAAGMIANVTVERTAYLATRDLENAVRFWETLHAVELGLGGGNEIAGAVWIGLVSVAALRSGSLGKITIGLGLLTGLGGLATLFPVLGDIAGVVFGLGAIAWFIAAGITLLLRPAS